ncbi:hypothetical protein CYMTET_21678 [Cymbomonas tetramitiformis]|uniref:MYND-type domain-containing protein n=1 Tax=Cymbomonas tetramitiformis TaxID=36881 RepID=A0AAE0L320_9CHLO|nr:hypothetical protein CYMTET_21678 [Cymbomonas tetramitiformis]
MVDVACCNLCGSKENLKVCVACHSVAYCCKEHQKSDWKHHKPFCHITRAAKESGKSGVSLDGGRKQNEYVGTLYWTPGTKFAKLPPFPKDKWPPPLGGDDWQSYMDWRFERDADDTLTVEASQLDGDLPLTCK